MKRRVNLLLERRVALVYGNAISDSAKRRAAQFQQRVGRRVVFRDGIVEQHTEKTPIDDVLVCAHLLVVGFDLYTRRIFQHSQRRRLVQGTNLPVAQLVQRRKWRCATAPNELFEREVVGNAETHLLRLVGRDLYSADHAVVQTAMQARDQPAPVILYELGASSQTASDGVDDLVLESRQLLARRIESVRGVTVRIRRPAQYRLGVHADRTEKEVNEEPGWPQHRGTSSSQPVCSSIRLS